MDSMDSLQLDELHDLRCERARVRDGWSKTTNVT